MIVTEHTVVCDGCGKHGATAATVLDAVYRSASDGWACEGISRNPEKNWCPECKTNREESPS